MIHLDLASGSSLTSYEAIKSKLKNQIKDSARLLKVQIEDGSPSEMLHYLIFNAVEKYNKQVVVLVDEYDKPILDSMYEPYISDVMKMLSDFYQELKSLNEYERFVFITGVTKFAHVSLFSGANNVRDLSKSRKYATMLGYTQEELISNFDGHIEAVANNLKKPKDYILSRMKLWYNGIRFTSITESLYNPVSVGCFFNEMMFDNYWIETGISRILLEKIKRTPFNLRDCTAVWQTEQRKEKYEFDKISVEELAFQTGYLTIVDWRETEEDTMDVRYDFPNKEIRDSWYSNIVTHSTGYADGVWRSLMRQMSDALNAKDLEALMEAVQNFFSGIPYENVGEVAEGYFRNQLHTLFTLFGIPNQCEVQQASQRADIVAQTRKMAVVFEVKMLAKEESGDEKKALALLLEAKRQAKEKGYADRYRNESEVVKSVAVVFDQKTRKMVKWEEAEL